MISLQNIRDQNNAVKYLSSSLLSDRIANSYLFSGPDGVGRTLTAKAFISALMCRNKTDKSISCGECFTCSRINTLEHPDLTWIKPEKHKAVKIDQIRQVKDVLNLKPYEAPVSVCVIEDAHLMTVASANALLKILEEPPRDALLILISSKKELLPETVISRCCEVRFGALRVGTVKDIIMEKDSTISEGDAYFVACFSQGSPGRALEMIGEDLAKRKKDVFKMLDMIAEEKYSNCLNWISEDKNSIMEDVEMLIMSFRDMAMCKEGLDSLALDVGIKDTGMYRLFDKQGIDKIYSTVEKLISVKRALKGNVNAKIVAQILPGMLK